MMMNWLKSLFSVPVETPVTPLEPEKPEAKIVFKNGRMSVESYNQAFIDDLKIKLGDLTHGKTDAEIVDTFLHREELIVEEPRLDVNHTGITEDGRVQMKLDWNPAFIKHLKQNGITGDTEEEAVNKYLALITKQAAIETDGLLDAMNPHAAMLEMDEILAVELDEAAKQVETAQRQARQSKRRANKKQSQ